MRHQALGVVIVIGFSRWACAENAAGDTDPLRALAQSTSDEIQLTAVVPGPEPCQRNELAQFEGPSRASPTELVRLRRKAELAVRSTDLPLCECRVTYVESPWTDTETFEIEHGSCWTLTIRIIAVAPDETTHLLTGDLVLSVEGGKWLTSADEALASFNRIAERERVVINNSDVAQDYLESFLRVYMPRAGSYLPNRKIADTIARLRPYGTESEMLRRAFKQIDQPVVAVHSGEGAGYRGTAFTWEWWGGVIQRIELTLDPSGRVSVVESTYAEQK